MFENMDFVSLTPGHLALWEHLLVFFFIWEFLFLEKNLHG